MEKDVAMAIVQNDLKQLVALAGPETDEKKVYIICIDIAYNGQ